MTRILGFSCYYHDAAAALVEEGVVVAAAEEERFSRRKHDSRFPLAALQFCLQHAGGTVNDVDAVVFYEKPLTKFHRMVQVAARYEPESWSRWVHSAARHRHRNLLVEQTFRSAFGYTGRFLYGEHHLSHGASAFFCSPFESAAVVTVDGVGEWTTATIGVGSGQQYRILAELRYPVSLGLFYSTFTAFLGFEVNNDEYKVMGLAGYGSPSVSAELDRIARVGPDGSIGFDLDHFCYHRSEEVMFTERLIRLLGEPHPPGKRYGRREMDLAASVQAKLEEMLLAVFRKAHELTGERSICLAGGVALNGVANWRCFRQSPFEGIFVQPAAGDSGGAIGAALYAYHRNGAGLRHVLSDGFSPYLGPDYDDADIERVLERGPLPYRRMGDEELLMYVARRIASDTVVGWFQGRMEFGPRALGNRSILADPRNPQMKEHINAAVKHREEFRPFAPAVTAESAHRYFDLQGMSAPFMILVPEALTGVKEVLPAVIHVDGTARVQTVSRAQNRRFHDLLQAVSVNTGHPVLLNTSFNVKGEPIVCSPEDAYRCFLNTDIDMLVMNNYVIEKCN